MDLDGACGQQLGAWEEAWLAQPGKVCWEQEWIELAEMLSAKALIQRQALLAPAMAGDHVPLGQPKLATATIYGGQGCQGVTYGSGLSLRPVPAVSTQCPSLAHHLFWGFFRL